MSEQEREQEAPETARAGELDEAAEADLGIVGEPRAPMHRGALLLFGLLAIGGAAVWALYHRGASRPAPTAQAVAATKTISTFLSGGEQNWRLMEQALRSTEKVVQQFLSYPSMTQVPLSDLRANPFRHAALKAAVADNKDEEAERAKREEERVAVMKAVQQLQLQSVMHSGTVRACMIDNTLYREGQTAGQFTIEKINPSAVIVKAGAYRFELRMQK